VADVSLLFNILARDQTAGGLNSASSGMDKFKARTSMAAIGILGAATAIGAKAISIASDTSESASKVATLFGKSAASVNAFAASSAEAYGMSKLEALGAVGSMGAVQIAMGTNAEAAAKTSLEYVKLSADLASFNNASSAEVQEALTGALSGEYEMLKKYGIVVNDSTMKLEAQRIGMKKSGDTWTAAQKQQLSHNIIMRSTTKAQGDFERTSGGLANQTKILQARMSDMSGEIGAKLLPIVVKVAGAFNSLLDWMGRNQTTTKVLATVIGGLAAVIVTLAVGMRIVSAVVTAQATAWRLLATVMWANPVFIIAGIIIAIGLALVVAYNKVAWFRTAVDAAFRAVWGAIKAVWDWIRTATQPVWDVITAAAGKVKDFLVRNWDTIKFAMTKAVQTMGGVYLKFADGVLGIIEGMLRAAGHLPKWLGGGVADGAAAAVAGIRSGLQSLKDKLDALPTTKKMQVELETAAALARIRELKGQVNGAGWTIDIKTSGPPPGIGVKLPARAGGGPVTRGASYMVGEDGPEIVTMGASGFVTPNDRLGRGGGTALGAAGGTVTHVHVLDVRGNSNDFLVQLLRREIRARGGNVQRVLGTT
jgi:hypothetical protein